MANVYLWAYLCFAVGVESSIGNIPDDIVPLYIKEFIYPINTYLQGWLYTLEEKRKINSDKAIKLTKYYLPMIFDTGKKLGRIGWLYGKELKPKDTTNKSSLFIKALKQVKISSI